MKKLLIIALMVCATITTRSQTVTLDFTVGILTHADGTTLMADGSLIQVIAAPTSGDFNLPTPTEFISGSEILLWSGAFDFSTTAIEGAMVIAPAPIPSSTLPLGYALMVRWFPTLSSSVIAPGFGTSFGQFSTVNDPSWTAPAGGSSVSYSFLTDSSGAGSYADALGAALQMTAVPEPATYAVIFGLIAIVGVAYKRRQLA